MMMNDGPSGIIHGGGEGGQVQAYHSMADGLCLSLSLALSLTHIFVRSSLGLRPCRVRTRRASSAIRWQNRSASDEAGRLAAPLSHIHKAGQTRDIAFAQRGLAVGQISAAAATIRSNGRLLGSLVRRKVASNYLPIVPMYSTGRARFCHIFLHARVSVCVCVFVEPPWLSRLTLSLDKAG